ncbi:MAG: HD domain-containing protein [Lachnospiraceae bacterium]|nr:HD domain-containing protein [Lachnospiraceae bacterium]
MTEKIKAYGRDILNNERHRQQSRYVQHGKCSVRKHCISVAALSLQMGEALQRHGIGCDERSLVRGALLHDYFLYDWHEKGACEGLHGFRHAASALKNAETDFDLNEREKDIIFKHMFPLNLTRVPACREAWIVTIADKICSARETVTRERLEKPVRVLYKAAVNSVVLSRAAAFIHHIRT